MGYDWNDLRYFLACARAGSLAAAGRSLKVDQTTVGRRLGALEEALGSQLFDRTPEGFTLTATGQRLLETAQTIEQATIISSGGRRAPTHASRASCGSPPARALSATFLASELIALHAAHPGFEVQL